MMDTEGVLTRPRPGASAADRVYEHAKSQILARHWDAQELVTEGELADAVGVSRTPVREALLRLQGEGLVRLIPKRGALVLPVTPAEVEDVLETRRLLEGFAIRKAVHASTPELTARLATCIARMRDAAAAHDVRAYVEADRDFHEELVAATGNRIVTTLYRSLRDRQLRMGVVNLLESGHDRAARARMAHNIADHEAILAAVGARTIRAAEAAVTAHLDRAEQQLRAAH